MSCVFAVVVVVPVAVGTVPALLMMMILLSHTMLLCQVCVWNAATHQLASQLEGHPYFGFVTYDAWQNLVVIVDRHSDSTSIGNVAGYFFVVWMMIY